MPIRRTTVEYSPRRIARLLQQTLLGGEEQTGAQYAAEVLQHLPQDQRKRLFNNLRSSHPHLLSKILSGS